MRGLKTIYSKVKITSDRGASKKARNIDVVKWNENFHSTKDVIIDECLKC